MIVLLKNTELNEKEASWIADLKKYTFIMLKKLNLFVFGVHKNFILLDAISKEIQSQPSKQCDLIGQFFLLWATF